MMVSMPFQLFHFDFVMGRDVDDDDDESEEASSEDLDDEDDMVEEDDAAWMFWSPSAITSK